MIDATSGSVIDDGPAGTTKFVVEADASSESQESHGDAHGQIVRGPGSVPLQAEEVFAGPEHRFDTLPDRSQMWSCLRLVLAGRPGEIFARVPFVTNDGLPTPKCPGQEGEGHLPFGPVGRSQFCRPRGTVRGADQMQPTSPEEAGVAARPAVSADITQGRTADRLQGATAFDRGGIKEKQVICGPGAPRTEDPKKPLDGAKEPGSALVIGVLAGQVREEGTELTP